MRVQLLRTPSPIKEKPLITADLPLPEPGDAQIRLRVTACGVCHTDLHTVEGDLDLPLLPRVPGHQVVGIVDAVGKDVVSFSEGVRAGTVWLYRTCGECPSWRVLLATLRKVRSP